MNSEFPNPNNVTEDPGVDLTFGFLHSHLGKPPASPEDSCSSTVPGLVRRPSGSFAPFPLTLTLSLREREQRAPRCGKPRSLDCSPRRGGFTLSPRERAGVRGSRRLYAATRMSL